MKNFMVKSDKIPLRSNDIYCDLCRKKIRTWNPFSKALKCVIRIKEQVWTEYYHKGCLEKFGILKKIRKEKAGRWDKDEDMGTGNLVH
jgi:hypothetical protein